jgi:hypothetical protein
MTLKMAKRSNVEKKQCLIILNMSKNKVILKIPKRKNEKGFYTLNFNSDRYTIHCSFEPCKKRL